MFTSLDISTSALVAHRVRMNAISQNLANLSTTRNEDGEMAPFQKRYVVLQAEDEQGAHGAAGVKVAEVGIDISGHTSDLISSYAATPMDWFITVCDHAAETCPLTPPGCRTLHWSFPDPPRMVRERGLGGDAAREVYRAVRDEIRAQVLRFA